MQIMLNSGLSGLCLAGRDDLSLHNFSDWVLDLPQKEVLAYDKTCGGWLALMYDFEGITVFNGNYFRSKSNSFFVYEKIVYLFLPENKRIVFFAVHSF